MFSNIVIVSLSFITILWCIRYLLRRAVRHGDLPSLPRNRLLGHLSTVTKYMKPDRHPDYGFKQIYQDLDEPDWYYYDPLPLPFSPGVIVVTSPAIAEQITQPSATLPYSARKSWTLEDINPIVGETALITSHGERWRSLRKQFAPGFQPRYLQTLLPRILAETKIFLSRLEEKSESGEEFKLGTLTEDMALDVMGSLVSGESYHAQTTVENSGTRGPTGILTAFGGIKENFLDRTRLKLNMFSPIRPLKLAYYKWVVTQRVKSLIMKDLEKARDSNSSRTIMSLVMKGRDLTDSEVNVAIDQVRTFLFAGSETTSSLLQWLFYYLSKPDNESIVDDLIAEHNEVLGTDPETVESTLLTNPPLPFTMAIIKETLRLEPPGGTARWIAPSDPPFTVTLDSGEVSRPLNGSVLFVSHRTLHQTQKIWGSDADVFRPSRWLDKEYMSTIPAGAFRPFERGPRDCMGQELALLETKVALVMTVRRFKFQKVVGQTCDLGDAWNTFNILPNPHDGMRMKVSRR